MGKNVVVVSHGITKQSRVPPREIDQAAERLAKYRADPEAHANPENLDDG